MIFVSAAYCPNCAALLSFEPGASHVTCEYCEASLVLDTGRVTHQRAERPSPRAAEAEAEEKAPPIKQPNPSLFVRDAARFRTRVIEQVCGEASFDLFRTVELDEDRFAIVSLRCVDDKGEPVQVPLESAWEVLKESLEDDGDPGLAANLTLEELSTAPGFQKLECAIAVLDPARTTVLAYCAGCRNALLWVSTEEARPILAGTNHQALERADLAKSGSQFDNGREIQLAAQDLVVFASFAYLNDGAIGSNVPRLITETLRGHLGEDPQRIVTLIKNEFWEQRESGYKPEVPLAGDLRIAAVGARLADPAESEAAAPPTLEMVETRHFQVGVQRAPRPADQGEGPVDGFDHWPLADDRVALLWMQAESPLPAGALETAREAVHAVLNKTSHGDYDNPRAAGRSAYEALARGHDLSPDSLRMLVVHLSDEHRYVKYFVRGWKAPLILGSRGLRPESEQQQYDEGGHVGVRDGARLFFPGGLSYEGNVLKAGDFAGRWYGGKSSHLYEALRLHWRTRKTEKALTKIVRAAAADTSTEAAQGMLLITGA